MEIFFTGTLLQCVRENKSTVVKHKKNFLSICDIRYNNTDELKKKKKNFPTVELLPVQTKKKVKASIQNLHFMMLFYR